MPSEFSPDQEAEKRRQLVELRARAALKSAAPQHDESALALFAHHDQKELGL